MKKNVFLTLVLILITWIGLLGQKSNKTLNYQAVILDPKAIDIPGASIVGQPLSKGNVCLRFSLLNGQGGLDYEETQSVTTDEYGLVNVAIGAGAQAQANNSTSVYKSFDSIVWNSSVKSLKVSVSYDGCSSFKQVSSQALNYTPYALYAEAVDYKNVRDAPTKLSQFSNDAGYLIPKDLDPLKAEITFNTDQLATANKTIADNKKSSDAAFLIVNQSITSLDMKVAENTSSIGTINTKMTDQQNQINDSRNQISAANAKLTDQQNQINDSRNQISATNNNLNSQIGGLQGQINAKSATIAANSNELALKANSDNPRLTGIVAVGTTNPSASAVLDINSTSQGMLVPRMTTVHRNAIVNPATALLIYNTSNNTFEVYKSSCSCWVSLTDGGGNNVTNLENNAPTVSAINYKGVYRSGGTANVVYTYSDSENDAEAATTILWEIANDNQGTAKTTYSTSATPTFTALDGGKYVRVKIIPRAATGILNGVDYYGGWTPVDNALKPYATSVNVTGKTEQGSTLTGSYTYNGGTSGGTTYTENTLGSTYVWQTASNNIGAGISNMTVPDGGTTFGKTIRPTINDVNKYVRFGVQAKDNLSNSSSYYEYSDWVGPITLAAEAAPVAKDVSYSPEPSSNITVKANYTYEDANYDPEGATLYQWYTADDATGTNQTAITGAKNKEFLITTEYSNKYIGLGITPIALTGNQTGTEVIYYSAVASDQKATFTIVSASQSSNNSNINTLTVKINVSIKGLIKFSTDTQNGYSFSLGELFYNVGSQNVTLNPTGSPSVYNASGDNFTITGQGLTSITTAILMNNVKSGQQFTSHFNGIVNGVHNTDAPSSPTYYLKTSYTTGETFNNNTLCATKPISASPCVGTSITVGSNTYSITTINGQCWMTQNLKELPNGTPINTNLSLSGQGDIGSYGFFNTGAGSKWASTEATANEGLLYQWSAAMLGSTTERAQGICPAGWHIPSECEFMYLEHGLGLSLTPQNARSPRGGNKADGYVGSKLSALVTDGTNSSGFTALMPGRWDGNNFNSRNQLPIYWTSSANSNKIAFFNMFYQFAGTALAYSTEGEGKNGHSVRCLKD